MRSIEIPQPEDRDWRYRAFEILPGALTWLILFLPVILSWISSKLAAYFIIAYLILWFIRAIGLDLRSLQGWSLLNQHKNIAWQKLNEDLEVLEPSFKEAPKWHARNLDRVKKYIGHKRIKPSEVIHAVVIATYNESKDVLEPTIQSVMISSYDMKKEAARRLNATQNN